MNEVSTQQTGILAIPALKEHYRTPETELPAVTEEELIDFLCTIGRIPANLDDAVSVSLSPLLDIVEEHFPGRPLPPGYYPFLAFLSEGVEEAIQSALLDPQMERIARTIVADLAITVLKNGLDSGLEEDPILSILDEFTEHCVGWSEALGRAGKQLFEKVAAILAPIGEGDADYALILANLTAFFDKDEARTTKLEQRLVDTESGLVRTQRAQQIAAQMLNREMQGNQLPGSITQFLQGPWCDSLKWLLIQNGHESEEWQRATKLTETLISTVKPLPEVEKDEDGKEDPEKLQEREADLQHLYRIIEHLPGEIRQLLFALEHDTGSTQDSMSDIEMEHINIISGQGVTYDDFELLDCDDNLLEGAATLSQSLMSRVERLEPGTWTLYEAVDKDPIRIKLVLKLDDVHQLLFTNRNGVKALQQGQEEFAYFLSSGIARILDSHDLFTATLQGKLANIVDEHERLQQALKEDQEERKREITARDAARIKALEEARAVAERQEELERQRQEAARKSQLQTAREEAQKTENVEKLEAAKAQVMSLNLGAWLKLPAADGSTMESKLAVKLAAADKFIFTDRSGMKMGEYTSDQLAELLTTGVVEILEEGVEFEDTLARVVTGLRSDRTRSYEDLTKQRA